MVSIQSQVTEILVDNPELTLNEVKKEFSDCNPNTIRSCFNRARTNAPNDAKNAKITMDMVEKLIVAGKTPVPSLRVMVDFLKIKQQDHSELEEIDLELFYKKAMED